MSRLAERLEERGKNFLSCCISDTRKSKENLRKKKRNQNFALKRIFDENIFSENTISNILYQYPDLNNPDLSPKEKKDLVFQLFNQENIEDIGLLLKCIENFYSPEILNQSHSSVDISQKLIECLKSDRKPIVQSALVIVINGTYGRSDFKADLNKHKAVLALIEIVTRYWNEIDLVVDGLWSLSHLIHDEKPEASLVYESDLPSQVVSKISHDITINFNFLCFSLNFFTALFRAALPKDYSLFDSMIQIIPKIIFRNEPEILRHCFTILRAICRYPVYIKKIQKPEIMNRLYYGLNSDNLDVFESAVSLCGIMITGDIEDTEQVVRLGIVDKCFEILCRDSSKMFKETLSILYNISIDCEKFKLLIWNHSLFDELVKIAEYEYIEIKIMALECLDSILDMLNFDKLAKEYDKVLQSIVSSLNCKDSRVLCVAISCCEKIFMAVSSECMSKAVVCDNLSAKFKELGGLEFVSKILNHPNSEVCNLAMNFMVNNFNVKD